MVKKLVDLFADQRERLVDSGAQPSPGLESHQIMDGGAYLGTLLLRQHVDTDEVPLVTGGPMIDCLSREHAPLPLAAVNLLFWRLEQQVTRRRSG